LTLFIDDTCPRCSKPVKLSVIEAHPKQTQTSHGFAPGATWEDSKVEQTFTRWERVAVVTDDSAHFLASLCPLDEGLLAGRLAPRHLNAGGPPLS
jgi:hypothetical protein